MSDFDAQEQRRRDEDKWHFKREISSGDLLLAGSMALGLILWGGKIESRLSVIEEKQVMQSRVDQAQDTTLHDGLARIEASLNDIQRYLREHK